MGCSAFICLCWYLLLTYFNHKSFQTIFFHEQLTFATIWSVILYNLLKWIWLDIISISPYSFLFIGFWLGLLIEAYIYIYKHIYIYIYIYIYNFWFFLMLHFHNRGSIFILFIILYLTTLAILQWGFKLNISTDYCNGLLVHTHIVILWIFITVVFSINSYSVDVMVYFMYLSISLVVYIKFLCHIDPGDLFVNSSFRSWYNHFFFCIQFCAYSFIA